MSEKLSKFQQLIGLNPRLNISPTLCSPTINNLSRELKELGN